MPNQIDLAAIAEWMLQDRGEKKIQIGLKVTPQTHAEWKGLDVSAADVFTLGVNVLKEALKEKE